MNGRIPIQQGFFIELKNGRAFSAGLDEPQVLPTVLLWQRTHLGHKDHERVQQWIDQKQKQIKEDTDEKLLDIRTEYVNTIVDEVARKSGFNKVSDSGLIDGIREAVFKFYGLPSPDLDR